MPFIYGFNSFLYVKNRGFSIFEHPKNESIHFFGTSFCRFFVIFVRFSQQ